MEIQFLVLCTLLSYASARCLGNDCEDSASAGSSKSSVSDISTISPGILIRSESEAKGRRIGDRNAKVILGSSGNRYGEPSSSGFGVGGAPIGTGSSYDIRPTGGSFGNSRPGGFDVGRSDRNGDYPGNRGGGTSNGFINSINTDPFNNRQPGSGLFPGGYTGNRYPGNDGYPNNNRGSYPGNDGYPDNNGGRFPISFPGNDGYPDNNRDRYPNSFPDNTRDRYPNSFPDNNRDIYPNRFPDNNRDRYPNSFPDNNQGRYPSNSFGVSNTGLNNLYPANNNNGGYNYGNGGYDGYDPSYFPGSGNTFTFLPGSGFVRGSVNPGANGNGFLGNGFFPQSNNQGFFPVGGIYTMPLGNTGRFPIDSNFNNNREFRTPNSLFFNGIPSGNPNDYPTGDNGRFFPGNNFVGGGSRYPSGGIGFVNNNNLPVSNTGFITPSVGTGYLPPPINTGYLPPNGK